MCDACKDNSLEGLDMLHVLKEIAINGVRHNEMQEKIIKNQIKILEYEKNRAGKV